MLRTPSPQASPTQDEPMPSPDATDVRQLHKASLQLPGDPASDGDSGERPVREKLKKTSIASIPKYSITTAEASSEDLADTAMASQDTQEAPSPVIAPTTTTTEVANTESEPRGRTVRKRSFDDLESGDAPNHAPAEETTHTHSRKRSRDVHSAKNLKSSSRRRSPTEPVCEEPEEFDSREGSKTLRQDLEDTTIEESSTNVEPEPIDHEMPDPVRSPKKKRSRDQFEADTPREQKIAATDENRARRRSSSEERRSSGELERAKCGGEKETGQNGHAVAPRAASEVLQAKSPNAKIPPTSGFANFSSTSPFGTIGTGKSVFGAPLPSTTDSASQPTQTQTSSSAFKSSGFASLAGSASPFSTFASSSTSTFTQPPRATSPEKSVLPGLTAAATDKPSGFAALSGTQTASPFGGAAVSSSFAKPGSMLFGGGFSGGFGGGSKLSSFAAPTGDIKLGAPKAKAFGASGGSDDEDSGSEAGDEEGDQSEKKEEEGSQFHVQEVVDTGEEGEQTLFNNRAKLLIFKDGKWAERGVGPLKLNVRLQDPSSSTDATEEEEGVPKSQARFLMRTQATHKVILNAPIFKEMSITAGKGTEPSGKQAMISIPIEGKVVPHMIKMGKEDDIKALYRVVKRLQEDM